MPGRARARTPRASRKTRPFLVMLAPAVAVAASEGDGGTLLPADFQVAGHPCEMLAGDDGAHVDGGAALAPGRADLQAAGTVTKDVDEAVGDGANGHSDAAGHAALAGAAK